MSDQWVQRFNIESTSRKGKFYTVAVKQDGTWACSCKAWTMHTPRRACKHISIARTGEVAEELFGPEPELCFEDVYQVIFDENSNRVLCPKPANNVLVHNTQIYDLLMVGVRISTIKRKFHVDGYHVDACVSFVEQHGRTIWNMTSWNGVEFTQGIAG